MKDETIIEVDETHRIKITKLWSERNCWGWELQKQELWRGFLCFKKSWHDCSWQHNGSFFQTVTTYYIENDALEKAQEIKRNFLSSSNQ